MLIDCKTQCYNKEEYFHKHEKGKDFINSVCKFYDVLNIKWMLDDIKYENFCLSRIPLKR